jgi:hypothetical protein
MRKPRKCIRRGAAKKPEKQVFWRYHPVTGEDANDLEVEHLTPEQRQELAEMIRSGARFYWELRNGAYGRVERNNIEFVLRVIAIPYEFIDARPEGPSSH